MKNQNTRRLGFTLIEVLVVVLIIGILAAVAIPQYQNAVKKARVREGMTLLSQIHKGFELYKMANGSIDTNDVTQLDINIPEELIIKTPTEWADWYNNGGVDDGKWHVWCYSMASCIVATGNKDLPNFEQFHSWDYMACRFHEQRTQKARDFCRTQLHAQCSVDTCNTAYMVRLP